MKKLAIVSLLVAFLSMFSGSLASAQTPQVIRIARGQTADIWFGANVSGKLHLSIRTRDGKNQMNIWWLTWGVGSTTNIGNWGPSGDLDIPITWWKGVVSAKLRGTATQDTVVYVSEKVAIDKSVTFNWP
jgi:hypothetical protein